MKEVWKEITESIEMKIVLIAVLSIISLFLLAAFFVHALSEKKGEESQEVTDINYSYFNTVKTNFTP